MGAVQASTLLRRAAGLAVDGRRDTCALTGMQEGAWWRADLGAEYNVTAVIIKGTSLKRRLPPHLSILEN